MNVEFTRYKEYHQMRLTVIAASLALAMGSFSFAHAADSYSTSTTTLGTMMADPAAKAVLAKHIPQMVNNPQMEQAGGLTLKMLQQYTNGALSDQVLAEIDDDLSKLPAKK